MLSIFFQTLILENGRGFTFVTLGQETVAGWGVVMEYEEKREQRKTPLVVGRETLCLCVWERERRGEGEKKTTPVIK